MLSFQNKLVITYSFFVQNSIQVQAYSNNDDDNDMYSCASYTSCNKCSISSSYCHWCSNDNSCHTIGSWYGCLYGTDCNSIEQCERSTPEYIGFSTSSKVIMVSMSLFVFMMVIWKNNNWMTTATSKEEEKLHNKNYNDENDDAIEMAYKRLPHIQDCMPIPKKIHCINKIKGGSDTIESLPTMETASKYTFQTLVVTISAWFTIEKLILSAKAITAAGLVTLTIMKFPKIPQMNICASQVNWYSILTTLLDGNGIQASIDILVSIYNPNSYDVTIDKAEGTFLYANTAFGTFYITPRLIKALSITDDTIRVTFFSPASVNTLYSMIHDIIH